MHDKRFDEILEHFRFAMLVTVTADGGLRSRPMTIADRDANGDIYFATHIKSAKIDEITDDSDVNVAMQDDRRFVSITGKAMVVNDKAKIKALFSPAWEAWFPGGADDPNLRLIKISSTMAEYWDYSGMKGLRFLFEAGKAMISDDPIDYGDAEEHRKLSL